jgi:anti-sigma regulatory factor (Ser/Thr protein kinase)
VSGVTVAGTRPHGHAVDVYDDERALIEEVARFAAEGLVLGETVVLVATAAHRAAVEDMLRDTGVDVASVLGYDAEALLASFMVAESPDPDRFRDVVGGVVSVAVRGQRPVRIFGEMVALLWDRGDVAAALALEELWNELTHDNDFSLLCAYSRDSLGGSALASASAMCGQHSHVTLLDGVAPTAPRGDEASILLVPVAAAVAISRQFVATALSAWGLAALADDAAVVVSELATNAVKHAGSAFRLTVSRGDSAVRISVADTVAELLAIVPDDPLSATGRGLMLVQALARSWGWSRTAEGKSVWAELSV